MLEQYYNKIKSRSIFNLIPAHYLAPLLKGCSIKEYNKGQQIFTNTDALYVVAEGVVELTDETGKSVEKIRYGRSIELKTFFSDKNSWEYQWLASEKTALIEIPKAKLLEIFNKEKTLENYLRKITTCTELHKIKNDLKLLGLETTISNEIISKFTEKSLSELLNNIQSYETKFVFVIRKGYLSASKAIDEDKKSVGDFIIGDYFTYSKGLDISVDYHEKTTVWALDISNNSSLPKDFIDLLSFLDPISESIRELEEIDKKLSEFNYKGDDYYKSEEEESPFSIEDFTLTPEKLAKIHREKFIYILQHDQMDCGAACLTMISHFYKRKIKLQAWRSIVTITKEGASILALKKGADEVGFDTIGVMSGYKGLQKLQVPFIALMQYHFVVVYKVTEKEVIVGDPGIGQQTLSKEDFLKEFSKNLLLIRPNKRLYEYPETASSYSKYIQLFSASKYLLLEVLLISSIIFVLGLAPPLFMQFIFDNVLATANEKFLKGVAIAFIALNLINTFSERVRTVLLTDVTSKLDAKFSTLFLRHVFKLPLAYFAVRNVGDITTRLQEVEKIREFFTGRILTIFINAISVILYGGILAIYSGKLFFVLLAFLPFFAIVMNAVFKRITPNLNKTFKAIGGAQSKIFEQIKSITTLKSLDATHIARLRWENSYTESLALRKSLEILISFLHGFAVFFQDFVHISLLMYASYLYIRNELTLGQVVAVDSLSMCIVSPLLALIQEWGEFSKIKVSIEKVDELITSVIEKDVPKAPLQAKNELEGDIVFNNVFFQYGNDTSPMILNGISLTIKHGETIAFVGGSGSGKSTMAYMVNRLYSATKGTISINGADINDLPLSLLRKNIAMIIQDNSIFSGSIAENISMGDPNPTMEKIMGAAQKADAEIFITSKPDGYFTILGENGSGLSGGQKQRLNIARALYLDPPILIMDEATSALDSISEAKVVNNIKARAGKRTTIIIAHRLNTIMYADRIFVLDNGNIVEAGTHKELMAQQGRYFVMLKKQMS